MHRGRVRPISIGLGGFHEGIFMRGDIHKQETLNYKGGLSRNTDSGRVRYHIGHSLFNIFMPIRRYKA
jgi:hypothetical protein